MKRTKLVATAATLLALVGGMVAISPAGALAGNVNTVAASFEGEASFQSLEGTLSGRFQYSGWVERTTAEAGAEKLEASIRLPIFDNRAKIVAEFFVNGVLVGSDVVWDMGVGASVGYEGLLEPDSQGKSIKFQVVFTIIIEGSASYSDSTAEVTL